MTGSPARRADEDDGGAGGVERTEAICVVREALETLVRILSPFAPHMAEEMWEKLGHAKYSHRQPGLHTTRGSPRPKRWSCPFR